jgi:hypothetical protein
LLDGVTLEQEGVPTATIITDVFASTAKAYVEMLGVPGFPYLMCEHPITSVGAEELRARARHLAPLVRQLLLAPDTATADASA